MRGIGKSRLMAAFVTALMVLSVLVIPKASMASPPVLSLSKNTDLTCGETIWANVTDGSLDSGQWYLIQIENTSGGSDWAPIETGRADSHGNLSIEFHVPYRSPPGNYAIRLVNDSNHSDVIATNTITIKNVYKVEYEVNGEKIEYAIWNKGYAYPDDAFVIKIYNWTGNKYELLDKTVNVTLYKPDGTIALTDNDISGGEWSIDYTFNYTDSGNYETNYLVKVFDGGTLYSNFTLPVMLDVTATIPSAVVWGDDVTINGYVKDGEGNGIGGYTVKLYAPVNGGYKPIDTDTTYNTGRFTLSTPTNEGSAGTWYIGTEMTSGSHRVSDYHNLNGISNFIWYYKMDVGSDNTASIEVKSPDQIISGFTQNMSVYVEWNNDPLSGAWVYITGLKANYNGTEYGDDENISIGSTDANGYCNFSIKFTETGTGTIFITWPEMNENYSGDYMANVTGTTTFDVSSPAPINVIVENPPTTVSVSDLGGGKWVNDTSVPDTVIRVYGNSEDKPINASINITGCGLNLNIKEDDTNYKVNPGEYHVKLNPKTGGTITITVTNKTVSNEPIVKEYDVSGLYGTVTTTKENDKKITVETNETILVTITGGDYAEVHATFVDKDWSNPELIYNEIGDGKTPGKGLNGAFNINVTKDKVDKIGHVIVAANAGSFWFYDIVDIVSVHDLSINISEPTAENQTLTAGVPVDINLKVTGPSGKVVDDIDEVRGKIVDEDGNTLQEATFSGPTSSDEWYLHDWTPWYSGTFIITATNNTGENEHDGNITLNVEYATITYEPSKLTAGIGLKNITVNVTAVDANGNPLPEGTTLYLNYDPSVADLEDSTVTLDSHGMGTFTIKTVDDKEGKINATLQAAYDPNKGNLTNGELSIEFPTFVVDPSEIYIGMSNRIKITAYDVNNNPIPGINITLVPSIGGIITQPDPVVTGEDGVAILSVTPQASGKLNVTIARDLHYENGTLKWNNSVITDTVITVTSLKPLEISLSKTPIYQGETLTVTVTSGNNPVEGATVTFGTTTKTTDASGQVTFDVPDPGVEFAVFTISAEKAGYIPAEKSLTVLKKYNIIIVGPSTPPAPGSKFTITITAKGSPLAGATVEFNEKTYTSDGEGKVTITAPSKPGDYTVSASYDNYNTGTLTIHIKKGGGVPGFELVTLVAAIGIAFILLRRRK